MPSVSVTSARSRITRPSLYRWLSSVANSYIQPSFESHDLHDTSLTYDNHFMRQVLQILPASITETTLYDFYVFFSLSKSFIKMYSWQKSYHVPSGEHYSILHLAERQIDNFVEKKSPARRTRESSADQFRPIREIGVASCARKQAAASHMLQKHFSHL